MTLNRLMVCPDCQPIAYYDPESPLGTRCTHCNAELIQLVFEVPQYMKADLADAWDEGYDAGNQASRFETMDNPYRKATP
jgi:hypothetical protein